MTRKMLLALVLLALLAAGSCNGYKAEKVCQQYHAEAVSKGTNHYVCMKDGIQVAEVWTSE